MKKLLSIFIVLALVLSSISALSLSAKIAFDINDSTVKLNNLEVESDIITLSNDNTASKKLALNQDTSLYGSHNIYLPLEESLKLLNKKPTWSNNARTLVLSDLDSSKNPLVTMEMENGKILKMELYPEKAPNTVNNFISLVNKGFYNGLSFHRVIPEFMIQGGDPNGNGTGGAEYDIRGEFTQNNEFNDLLHHRGIVSMARSSDFDSASSQFFIVVKDSHFLNGSYAAFGKVVEGMDLADEIALVQRDARDKPLEAQVIKTMTVETFGKQYSQPIKITEESILADMYGSIDPPSQNNQKKHISRSIEAKLSSNPIKLTYRNISFDDKLIVYNDVSYISLSSLKNLLNARIDYYSKTNTFNLIVSKNYSAQKNPLVSVNLSNGKSFKLELYPNEAPNTVSNFISLVDKGFYNGKSFHRMLADNMVQGGQDLENTMKYLLPGEFATNGYENALMQTRATISMVNIGTYKASSPTEFFINLVDHPSLNGNFAPFGRVVEGMNVIDEISRTKTDANASAINPVVIKNITVDTFNVNYKEARKMKLQNKVLN